MSQGTHRFFLPALCAAFCLCLFPGQVSSALSAESGSGQASADTTKDKAAANEDSRQHLSTNTGPMVVDPFNFKMVPSHGEMKPRAPGTGEPGGPDLTVMSIGMGTSPTAARWRLKRQGYLMPRTYTTDIYTIQEFTPVHRGQLFPAVHLVFCTSTEETAGIYFSSPESEALLTIARDKFRINGADMTVRQDDLVPGHMKTWKNYRHDFKEATASYYKVKNFPTWVLALENPCVMRLCRSRQQHMVKREESLRGEINRELQKKALRSAQ